MARRGNSRPTLLRQLKQVRQGDRVLCYHAAPERALYALAEVTRDPYPDPHDTEEQEPGRRLARSRTAAAAGDAGRVARQSGAAQTEVSQERAPDHFSAARRGVSGDSAHGRHRCCAWSAASLARFASATETAVLGLFWNRSAMPELPEVETVVRGLRCVLPGRTHCRRPSGQDRFHGRSRCAGRVFAGPADRRRRALGKFIRMPLAAERHGDEFRRADEPDCAPGHDRASGGALGRRAGPAAYARIFPSRRRQRAALHGHSALRPNFALAGRRAWRRCAAGWVEDPLEISAEDFCRELGGRRARIKALLLDQSVLRGVGNIYADESLWRSAHSSRAPGGAAHARELLRLRQALQRVLRAAIEQRGSSISNFWMPRAKPGGYQRWHRVYQRTGKPARVVARPYAACHCCWTQQPLLSALPAGAARALAGKTSESRTGEHAKRAAQEE